MRNIDINGAVIQLGGFFNDTGGSRVGEGLVLNLEIVGRMKEDCNFSTCSLHGLSLTMINPITKFMGDSIMHKHTTLQLLYIFHVLQNSYETEEFKEVWKLENDNKTCGIRFA